MFRSSNGREYLLEEEQRGDDEVRTGPFEAANQARGAVVLMAVSVSSRS